MGKEKFVFEKASDAALEANKGGKTSESWLLSSRVTCQTAIAVLIVPVSTLRCEPVEL